MTELMNWFVRSSADPAKLALTVRGLLVSIVPIIMIFSGLSEAEINPAIDAVVTLIEYGFMTVAAAMTLWGFLRKLAHTFLK